MVFVTHKEKSYVRSKPGRVKQTQNTKVAATKFGFASQKDKAFRIMLQSIYPLYTDSRYANRHRALLLKMLDMAEQKPKQDLVFEMPEVLQNFCFNSQLPWEKVIRFYPTYGLLPNNHFTATIPTIKWKEQVLPLKNMSRFQIHFHAFLVNLTTPEVVVEKVSDLVLLVTAKNEVAAQDWTFSITPTTAWLVVLATVVRDGASIRSVQEAQGTSSYVFATTCFT